MAEGGFVAYYRVSTARQGVSGLGLDAQKETVRRYLNGGAWTIKAEYTEVESGRKSARPELERALATARLLRVPLIVANVSRLTRSSAFLQRILDGEVEVRFCDLPKIEGHTGLFLLRQMASVAELEAGMIGSRTKDALDRAKARGKKLGGDRGVTMSDATRAAGQAARVAKAKSRAADLLPVITDIREAGTTTLAGIADALNTKGIPTARGGKWSAVQVDRAIKRAAAA